MNLDDKCQKIIADTIHATIMKAAGFEDRRTQELEKAGIKLTKKLCVYVLISRLMNPNDKNLTCGQICTDVSKIIADKLLEAMEEINKL